MPLDAETETLLKRIADRLGCSVDDFFGASTAASESAALGELLHLWQRASQASRRRILDFARRAAGQDGDRDGPAD
ncbi:hypothetical protein Q8W71_32690 [Methylobacterium sp. NEAU 140]|uniref:hypothetical protein n=1 Tax=Methylobacterium sp. NEAU 140 TaxID=3064945 RepID=UPI002734FF92|nr:hypothetical protein [Methylobacterium sp. NEAU 140]MDP4027320.1 hypothetical protein [Methylobacterium sp. NEAU 140]